MVGLVGPVGYHHRSTDHRYKRCAVGGVLARTALEAPRILWSRSFYLPSREESGSPLFELEHLKPWLKSRMWTCFRTARIQLFAFVRVTRALRLCALVGDRGSRAEPGVSPPPPHQNPRDIETTGAKIIAHNAIIMTLGREDDKLPANPSCGVGTKRFSRLSIHHMEKTESAASLPSDALITCMHTHFEAEMPTKTQFRMSVCVRVYSSRAQLTEGNPDPRELSHEAGGALRMGCDIGSASSVAERRSARSAGL